MIRAFGALANRVELQLVEQRPGVGETRAGGQSRAQPIRQARMGQ